MTTQKVRENLKHLFNPDTVAVVGASDNPEKLGFHVMKSLTEGDFKGRIIPINPGSASIGGCMSFPSIAVVEGSVDLAIVVVPAILVPGVFEECFSNPVKGIVLITAGFKEIDDPKGARIQEMLRDMANEAGVPVIGPNTFGVINIRKDLNASFTPEFSGVDKGSVALVSQSGGVSHLFAFKAMRENLSMSKIVGLGNRLNVDFADMVDYLMEDPDTQVILLYIEGIDDPRGLMAVARKHRGKKPIVAYKVGLGETGDRASLSHTGSMAGKYGLYEGALRQSGILLSENTEDLLDVARAVASCPLPGGKRIGVLSGQAGPAMAACDVCEGAGLEIVSFHPNTQERINGLLPPLALRTNPVDLGPAWYDSSAIGGIVQAVLEDNAVDGILLLMMFASANREAVRAVSDLLQEWNQKKPVVSCFVAPPGTWDQDIQDLEDAGALVNFTAPERAARAMAALWNLARLLGRA